MKLSLGPPLGKRLPQLGVGVATHDVELSPADTELLRELHFDHLRVDLYLNNREALTRLERAERECTRARVRPRTRAVSHQQCPARASRPGTPPSARGAGVAHPGFSRTGADYLAAVGTSGTRQDCAVPARSADWRGNKSVFRRTEPVAPEHRRPRRCRLLDQPASPRERRTVSGGEHRGAARYCNHRAHLLRRASPGGQPSYAQTPLQPGCGGSGTCPTARRAAQCGGSAADVALRRRLDRRQHQATCRGRCSLGYLLRNHGLAGNQGNRPRLASIPICFSPRPAWSFPSTMSLPTSPD